MGNEARKRKIIDKSSDRLALISGRLESLDTQSPPSTPVSPRGKRPNSQFSNLARADGIVKEVESPALNTRTLSTYKPSSSSKEKDDANTSKTKPPSTCFSAKNINHCILSSEDTRVFCSIMIALLVVIAYANLPRHVVKSESLIASRPLYVLLLSDVMIVLLRIAYATRHREFGGKDGKSAMNSREGGGDNWEVAIVVLEWGLVLYQCVRAAFIDCSFYLVIVTCGFSFM